MDYDGTLTTTHKIPEFASPGAKIIDTLTKLCQLPNTFVYILSGRDRVHLDRWFSETGVGLSAEHGCFYKHPTTIKENSALIVSGEQDRESDNGWYRLVNQFDTSGRDVIRPLFQHYTERTPGSFIEEKEINLTWHYRNADPEFGSWQAAELQVNLEKILSHMPVSVSIRPD